MPLPVAAPLRPMHPFFLKDTSCASLTVMDFASVAKGRVADSLARLSASVECVNAHVCAIVHDLSLVFFLLIGRRDRWLVITEA